MPNETVDDDGNPIVYREDGRRVRANNAPYRPWGSKKRGPKKKRKSTKEPPMYGPKRKVGNPGCMDLDPGLQPTHTLGVPILKPPYMADITRRLLLYVQAKIDQPKTGQGSGGRRFSLRRLAEKSGLGYWSLVDYFVRHKNVPPVESADALMYGLGINVLDLLLPAEIAQRWEDLPDRSRASINQIAAKRLVKLKLNEDEDEGEEDES